MTDKPENPPAFPVSTIDGFTQHGMTLRDYFAGMVLAGISGQALENASKGVSDADFMPEAAAVVSYALADAMLTERAKRGEP